MICPICGYALSAFDKTCPRCELLRKRVATESWGVVTKAPNDPKPYGFIIALTLFVIAIGLGGFAWKSFTGRNSTLINASAALQKSAPPPPRVTTKTKLPDKQKTQKSMVQHYVDNDKNWQLEVEKQRQESQKNKQEFEERQSAELQARAQLDTLIRMVGNYNKTLKSADKSAQKYKSYEGTMSTDEVDWREQMSLDVASATKKLEEIRASPLYAQHFIDLEESLVSRWKFSSVELKYIVPRR